MNLFKEGDDLIQSRVRKVLERLGVRNLYPADIIKHHIVPVFTSSTCSVSTGYVILYLELISYNSVLMCIYLRLRGHIFKSA